MLRYLVIFLICAAPALAEAPDRSIFPKARPLIAAAEPVAPDLSAAAIDAATQAALDAVGAAASAQVATSDAGTISMAMSASPFPRPRPELGSASDDPTAPVSAPADRRPLLAGLFAPRPRPARTEVAAPRGNGICGNPALTGQPMPTIRSRTNGCGVEDPVQITAVDGIRLSMASTMDCDTANALALWVEKGLRPAFPDQQVVGLQIAGHYICRTRNHRPGARVSEHGRGKAIDIAGIIFADGTILTVAHNWNRALRAAYQAGCGIFGTTLGPGSDGYHEDHMHFDTADHRNGPYCR